MPPKDITQTGPQTGDQIRKSREEEFSQYYGDYRRWNNYMKMRNSGFSDSQVYQMYQDLVFKNTYGNDPNYDKLTKMSAEQRTRKLITDKKMQEGAAEGRANAELNFNLPEVDANPWAHPERGRMDFMRPDLVEARVRNNPENYKEESLDGKALEEYNKSVLEEASKRFPNVPNYTQGNDVKPYIDKKTGKTYTEKEAIELGIIGKLYRNPEWVERQREVSSRPENKNAALMLALTDNSTMSEGPYSSFVTSGGINTQSAYNQMRMPTGKEFYEQAMEQARADFIRDNLKISRSQNPFFQASEEFFIENLKYISPTYSLLAGNEKWLPSKDIDFHQLYLDNKADMDAGRMYKVEHNLESYFGKIVEKYQPTWSGGDELVHSKAQVFFEQVAAGAVENLMDFVLVPAGLIQGGWNALVNGDNFWEEASYLPSIAHDVAHGITGDHSQAYGDSWGSAMANSGYTVGTMAVDAGLMAIPYGKLTSGMLRPMSKLGVASEKFLQAARALESAKASKIFGTANALNFGVIEGSIDAIDVREGILEDARRTAMSLPEDQRAEFMEYATHEANTAYGRTMLEESLVVNAGTLLGLGFYGSLAPASRMSRIAPKWQTNLGNQLMSGNKWQKAGLFAGKVLEGNMRLTAGELLEEYAQGMSSGINRARANYNIDNYAMALHYGLGAEYLANTQLGFMQGLERFAPQAWTEMDPENLTKQVLLSTMMFRGLHMPGRGKTRAQINIDNDTKIGKIWDNIRKFSPVQTGIGQIIADAKSDVFDIENSLEHGFRALTQNDNIQDVLQTQAALTDIGIQMQDALNNQDITSYQKLAAAYQVAQAVMLANASTKNTRFGKHYEQVLSNRANFDSLSAEDKQKVLANYLDELQVNTIKQLPQEEQIKVMKETAQRALDLKEKASAAFEKFSQNGEFLGEDIRPLVFGELLNNLAPEIIKENWDTVSPAVNKVLFESDIRNRGNQAHREAIKLLTNNYFSQSDFNSRVGFLYDFINGNVNGVSKEEASKVYNEVLSEISKEVPTIKDVVNADVSLASWKNDIYSNWNKMYQNVMRGEGTLTEKDGTKLFNLFKAQQRVNMKKRERVYVVRIEHATSAGQIVNILDEMSTDKDLGDKRLTEILSMQFKDNDSVREALKIREAAESMKDILSADLPASSEAREYLPSIDAEIDRASRSVDSKEELLSLNAFRGVTNPLMASAIAYAIVKASESPSVNISDTPVSKHTEEELVKGTTSDSTKEDENPTPTSGAEVVEATDSGLKESTSSEKEPTTADIQDSAIEGRRELDSLNDRSITILSSVTSGQLDPSPAGRELYEIKQSLIELEKRVPGDELRAQVKEAIGKITESIKDVMALEGHEVLPVLKTKRQRRKVIKAPYWEGIKAFKKDVLTYFREARQNKQNTTPESFINKFWNPSYEHFNAIKEAFLSLIPSTETNKELAAKQLFEDYFTNNKRLKTDRKGRLDFIAEDILRQALGLVSEDEELHKAGAPTYKEYYEQVTDEDNASTDKYTFDSLVSPEYTVKNQARAAVATLIKEKGVIIDLGGELPDTKVKWVAHRLKNGNPPNRKNGITLDNFLDKNFNDANREAALNIIKDYAQNGLPTQKELIQEEYQEFLSKNDIWDRIYEARNYENQSLDELAAQGFYDEMESWERELNTEYLRELSEPVSIKLSFGKNRTYDYSTTNLDYEPGQTISLMTPFGPKTVTVIGYGNRTYKGTLKNLDDILIPSLEKAQENIRRTIEENSNKKHKVAIQNAFVSSTEKIKESHGEVLDVLDKVGAKQFIMKGNLHEGDELGFVTGTWESPEGTRPVVYIVTKRTYENGSNGNPLFKGHQVIGVFDTDAATDDSEVWNTINDYRKTVTTGDYFEIPNLPIRVSNVSSSGVKYKSIVGIKRTSQTVENSNLNKILDRDGKSFGISYDGKVSPVIFISNVDGVIQSSDPNYDLSRIFNPSKSASENSKRIIGDSQEGILPEKVTLMVVPTPSGDTAQLAVYAIDDTIEDFYPRISNLLNNSVIGDNIKRNLKERMMYLWRTSKGVKDLEKVSFALSTYFRLNNEGIIVTYNGGNFVFSLGKDKVLFTVPYDIADINQASKTAEGTESIFDGMKRDDGKTMVDVAWETLAAELSNSQNPIIRAVNLSVSNMANNPNLAQELISTGTLYTPNAELDNSGKITLDNASFTAYAEGTAPEREINTASKDYVAPTATQSETKPLSQQSQRTSTSGTKAVEETTPKESSDDLIAGPVNLTGRGKKNLKMKSNSKFSKNTVLNTQETTSKQVVTNNTISTLSYEEAIKHCDISISKEKWDSYSEPERLQYLNCK